MRDASRIVTEHEDRAVQLWNAKTGDPVGDALREHSGSVQCVFILGYGKRVASGSQDEMVRA